MKLRITLAFLLVALVGGLGGIWRARRRLEARASTLARKANDAHGLRARLDALNGSLAELRRARMDALQAQLAARRRRNPAPAASIATSAGFVAASELKDIGNSSPGAAAESYLWALRVGDIATLKRLFSFDPLGVARIRAFWESLPASDRGAYHDAKDLFLSLYVSQQSIAPWVAVRVRAETVPATAAYTSVDADYEYTDGRVRQHSVFPVMLRRPDGWQLYAYPEMIAAVIRRYQNPLPEKRWNDE